MSEIEQRLWREAEIEAREWLKNLAGGVVQSWNSYNDPQANQQAIYKRTVNVYNWKVEEHNRRIRGE